tara:strand:+ start:4596 stop:4826 length:231 start_codon:yes stop_codon:yes gene_type:complete
VVVKEEEDVSEQIVKEEAQKGKLEEVKVSELDTAIAKYVNVIHVVVLKKPVASIHQKNVKQNKFFKFDFYKYLYSL